MREARIILPLADNDGRPVEAAHDYLKARVCRLFGGFTANPVMGGWMDNDGRLYEDRSIAYDVAMADTAENAKSVATIARIAGDMAKQLAVYTRLPDGSVDIIDLTNAAAKAA